MDGQELIGLAVRSGASGAKQVDPSKIRYHQELRKMCEMNSCGEYGKNWGCPPGCGTVEELSEKATGYKNGVVYQYIGQIEDSFDFEGMMECGKVFLNITETIKDALREKGGSADFWVLGAGGCRHCAACTYPDAPCSFPEKQNISVEACGINVSDLCGLAGLNYINGEGTVTNTGVILY